MREWFALLAEHTRWTHTRILFVLFFIHAYLYISQGGGSTHKVFHPCGPGACVSEIVFLPVVGVRLVSGPGWGFACSHMFAYICAVLRIFVYILLLFTGGICFALRRGPSHLKGSLSLLSFSFFFSLSLYIYIYMSAQGKTAQAPGLLQLAP